MNLKSMVILMLIFLASMPFITAAPCSLVPELINQDPYPAIPGEYVKVVFQLNGLGNPDCSKIQFGIIEEFPFSLDEGVNPIKTIQGGTYSSDFKSSAIIPYKLRVHKDAFDGINKIDIQFSNNNNKTMVTKEFDIEVENLLADFEVSIKDYVQSTKIITFEILNTAKGNVEALTVEIPNQDNIIVKGTNRNIVGSLDSNEDTTFTFEATPKEGDIKIVIWYTDEINIRRSLEKIVAYNPSYFTDRIRDSKSSPIGTITIIIVVALIILWFFWAKHKKKKARKLRQNQHN